MPLVFALGQHASLRAIDDRLAEGDRLMAFLGRCVHHDGSRAIAARVCMCRAGVVAALTHPRA